MKTIAVPVDFLNQVIVRLNDMAKGYVAAAGVTRSNISALADQARLYAAAPPQSEPTNAAALQVNAGSPTAGSDPAPAAVPVWSNCTHSRCQASMRCEWPDTCQLRQNAAPEQEGQSLESSSLKDEGRAESAPAAAPFTIPACAELSVTPAIYAAGQDALDDKLSNGAQEALTVDNPVPAAHSIRDEISTPESNAVLKELRMRHAPSTLPLSAEEINAMKGLLGANTLCDQALRAIDLEQQLSHTQKAKQYFKKLHAAEQDWRERAEAELAELKARGKS